MFAGQGGTGALLIRVDPKGPWPDSTKTARVGTPQYTQGIAITPGARYDGEVSLRGFDGAKGKARCEIREYDGYKIINTKSSTAGLVDVNSDWTRLSCVAYTTPNTKTVALRIYISDAVNGEKFLADNALLTKMTTVVPTTTDPLTSLPTDPPPPSTITAPPTTIIKNPKPIPDASNTGVRPGTGLTQSGKIVVTQDNSVIEKLYVTGTIYVRANNVTIRNVYVNGTDMFGIKQEPGYTGLVMEDIEIAGPDRAHSALDIADAISAEGGFTLRRGNIHGFIDGAKLYSNTIVEDSFFHDNARVIGVSSPETKADGLQAMSGHNVVIRNNSFIGSPPTHASMDSNLKLQVASGEIYGYVIENNHFQGGVYTVYIDSLNNPATVAIGKVTFKDNVFAKDTWARGPVFNRGHNLITWYENTYDDGTVINL